MLAEPRPSTPGGDGWVYELKYDGYRLLAQKEGRVVRLTYRSGRDATALFPELVAAVGALEVSSAILDGEACVLAPDGRTDFGRMQQRGQLGRPKDALRLGQVLPVTFFAFDLLELCGHDLRPLTLLQRKALLEAVLGGAPPPLRYASHVARDGEGLFTEVEQRGLEGVVAKRALSPYRAGRWPDWLKVTTRQSGDFAVLGLSAPDGARSGFGALHLGQRNGEEWVYAGKVGSGFSQRDLDQLAGALAALPRERPRATGPLPTGRGNTWVRPALVVEVRYKAWPPDGQLRAPVFLRLRDDKRPEDCAFIPVQPPAQGGPARRDKVFWPDEGITKGELADYYAAIAPLLLPYLADRPLVITRFPDGIRGKSFFQSEVPDHAPDWVRRELLWNEDRTAKVRHLVCDDARTLAWLVDLGTIPLHLWSARAARLDRPDWCILDLDPKTAPLGDVLSLAQAIHALCEALGLPSYPKTSGGSGLHVLIPLGGQLDHPQATGLGELLARVIAQRHPRKATVERNVAARRGRVYVDYLQNGFGRLLAAPYCVRPVPGARVSAPLSWDEVNARLDPGAFTVRTMLARTRRLGEDPLSPVLSTAADVPRALALLERELRRGT